MHKLLWAFFEGVVPILESASADRKGFAGGAILIEKNSSLAASANQAMDAPRWPPTESLLKSQAASQLTAAEAMCSVLGHPVNENRVAQSLKIGNLENEVQSPQSVRHTVQRF